jgi:hypothetical protein
LQLKPEVKTPKKRKQKFELNNAVVLFAPATANKVHDDEHGTGFIEENETTSF